MTFVADYNLSGQGAVNFSVIVQSALIYVVDLVSLGMER